MTIDIDKLSETELVDLNRRIVERLRFLQQARAHVAMLRFRIGDRVVFEPDARGSVQGVIVRYNRKSVSVLADDGMRWTVAPGFLRLAAAGDDANGVSPSKPALLPRGD